jgi:hypothetical protein
MSVRPVLLKDIRRTAIEQHRMATGTGDYNRYTPLVSRDRSFSFGKRKLSQGDSNPEQPPKAQKFDSSVVFEQLKGQDKVLGEVKEVFCKIDGVTLGDETPQPVREVIGFMRTALGLLFNSQENLTSVLVDSCKVNASSGGSKGNKAAAAVEAGKTIPPTAIPALQPPPGGYCCSQG